MFRRVLDRPDIHFPFITLLSLLLFFPFLGARDFWGLETLYAEVARIMLLDGNYALPRVNETLWTESPPLYFWLTSFASWLAGRVNEWTIRFPSALSATELMLVFYYFVRKRFTARLALLSTVVLATSVLTIHVERHVPINTTFYLFVVLSLFLLMEVLVFESNRASHAYGVWLAAGLACLTNGPIGIFIPVMVVFAYLVLAGRWKRTSALRPFTGVLLFLAVVGPWIAFLVWKTPGGWTDVVPLLHNFFHAGHRGPDHQFFFRFPLAFSPWCFLLVPAIISLWPERSKWRDDPILFLLVWFCFAFLFAEFLKGRHSHYLFLAYFPTALGLGVYLERLISSNPAAGGDASSNWTHRFVLLCCVLFIVGGLSAPFVMSFGWPFLTRRVLVLGVALVALALFLFYASKRRDYHGLISGFVIFAVVVNVLLNALVFPVFNKLKARHFAEQVGAAVSPGSHLAIYQHRRTLPGFNFYSRIKKFEVLNNTGDIVGFLNLEGPHFVLVNEDRMSDVAKVWREDLKVLLTGDDGSEHWQLLYSCNQRCDPPPAAAE